MTIVADCPCHYLRRYENFIWANRDRIGDYMTRRADGMAASADMAVQEAERLQAARAKIDAAILNAPQKVRQVLIENPPDVPALQAQGGSG